MSRPSMVAQMVKNLSATRETWIRSLGLEDPLEKGMATHSSISAWRILQYSFLVNSMDRGACRLQSMGLQRVRHDWTSNTHKECPYSRDRETMAEIHGNKLIKGLSSDFSTLGFYSKNASLRKYMAQVTSFPEESTKSPIEKFLTHKSAQTLSTSSRWYSSDITGGILG